MNPITTRLRRGRTAGTGAALLLLATTLTACGDSEAEAAPTLATSEVVRRDLQITAEATGTLEPIRTIEVKSKASGEVQRVHVDTGDRVEPGALLVSIDDRDVQNDFDQTQADFEVAQERLNISEAQLRRSEELLGAGIITAQEHEGRNLDFANARAALVRAQTNLDLTRLRLEDVTIRSPLTGTVLSKTVEEGAVIQSASGSVSGGTTLLTIANLDIVQVRTLIDQTDVGRIRAGMVANVRVEALPDQIFRGQVEKIEPQAVVQQNVVMFPVVVHLENPEYLLKPGMSAEVTVVVAERPSTLTLPNNAIVTQNEVEAAASVLGVAESRAQLDPAVFQQMSRDLAASRGEASASAETEAPAGASLEAIRARVQSGEITQEEARALMAEAMGGAGGGAAGGAAAPAGGMRGAAGFARARANRADPDAGRPGVVFVIEADGLLSARAVLIGVNDWNNSEILMGVEEGEEVALIGGAALLARQQERNEQMRGRMGGGLPFGR